MAQFIFDSDVKNDEVDIYTKPKINLKAIATDGPDAFCVQMESDAVDNSVSNAIRLTIMKKIPIYGFHRYNIHVDNDKSYNMYNNDMIFNLIETLPIFDVPNYFDLENPETFLPSTIMREVFGKFALPEPTEVIEDKADKNLFKIEFSLNVKNTTDNFLYVTSHHASLTIDGKNSNSYHKRDPISILVLKPDEYISLKAEANLGISTMSAIYEATTNVVSKEITSRKYEINYETLGQLGRNMIFQKACVILVKKLKKLHTYIKKKYPEEPNVAEYMEIQLHGEDHTLGNVIATTLQKCNFISEAGYNKPHPKIENIVIKYRLKPKAKIGPIKVFLDVVAYLIMLYETIRDESMKLK